MCNYYASKWKREHIVDHKFDYVNVDEFRDGHWYTMLTYCFKVFLILKSVVIYIADIWTALVLLELVKFALGFLPDNPYLKWVFLASILCSFLLLLWDVNKAYKIMKSRDIAFAYTDNICYNLYILKSYSYFCIFHRIEYLKNARDFFAFFVYFRLKRWKRTLLAEAPRQIINGWTLFNLFIKIRSGDISFRYSEFAENATALQKISLGLIIYSFIMFVLGFLLLLFAIIIYIPLICQVQGNLKEYVCHKIDKRVGKMVHTKSRRRALETQRRQEQAHKILPQSIAHRPKPTLPNITIDDDDMELNSNKGSIKSYNLHDADSKHGSQRSNYYRPSSRNTLSLSIYEEPYQDNRSAINPSPTSNDIHKRPYSRTLKEEIELAETTSSISENSRSSETYYYHMEGRKTPSSSTYTNGRYTTNSQATAVSYEHNYLTPRLYTSQRPTNYLNNQPPNSNGMASSNFHMTSRVTSPSFQIGNSINGTHGFKKQSHNQPPQHF